MLLNLEICIKKNIALEGIPYYRQIRTLFMVLGKLRVRDRYTFHYIHRYIKPAPERKRTRKNWIELSLSILSKIFVVYLLYNIKDLITIANFQN